MAPLPRPQLVECTTLDGTKISALLYTVDGPAPAIIMSHGFNCVKEMSLPEVAEGFQKHGFNVLLYDARSVGASGGQPRNLLNPFQLAEDLSGERFRMHTYLPTRCDVADMPATAAAPPCRHLHVRVRPAVGRPTESRGLGHVLWRCRDGHLRCR